MSDLMKLNNAEKLAKSTSLDDLIRENENVMLLIDTSGSMSYPIHAGEPKTRIEGLREVVAEIKAQGEIPMIAFGGDAVYGGEVRFVDLVPDPAGGTPMHAAIEFAKSYGATRLVIVSDGMPDLRSETTTAAKNFGGRIDVIFVGTPGEGDTFLRALAKSTGGDQTTGNLALAKQLSGHIIGLLTGGAEEKPKTVIMGEGFSAAEPEPDAPPAAEDEDDDAEEDDDE